MTAQRKISARLATVHTSAMHSGDGMEMFSSGNAPVSVEMWK